MFKSGARGCAAAAEAVTEAPKPTPEQIKALCLAVGIPMVGFGFADNFIMIIAGDLIGKPAPISPFNPTNCNGR